jgi:alanine racemase
MIPLDITQERCWLEIDLDAIASNIRSVAAYTGKPVLAVIKANGCGHGLVQTARAVLAGGAKMLGVGTAGEAFELIDAKINTRILILGFVPYEAFDQLCKHGVELAIWDTAQQHALAEAAERAGRKAAVHIWVDMHMGRFGIPPENALSFLESCSKTPQFDVKGLMGHLPSVEERPEATKQHIAEFAALVSEAESKGPRPPEVHLSNSDALSFFETARFDMVRAGVIMYGAPGSDRAMPLKAAMTWKARILDIQVKPKGSTIGYGGEYVCEADARIAVIGVGYADGYRRMPKNINSVIFRGKETPVIGRVKTQNCIIILPSDTDAKVGETVTVLGTDGGACLRAEDLAARWQTNTWDVFCGISAFVPRVYHGG